MRKASTIGTVVIIGLIMALGVLAYAQVTHRDAQTGKTWLVAALEKMASTSDRQVQFSQVEGLFSSNTSVGLITVSDEKGVWLRIENARMDWNRLALLGRKLSINALAADKIDVVRKPSSAQSAAVLENGDLALPDFPPRLFVDIAIQSIKVKQIDCAEKLFGLGARASMAGHFFLANGALDSNMSLHRLDADGTMDLTASLSPKSRQFHLDAAVSEPANGLLSHILEIDDYPAVAMTLKGHGSLDDATVKLFLDVQPEAGRLQSAQSPSQLHGLLQSKLLPEGRKFDLALDGPLAVVVPPAYRPLLGPKTTVAAAAVFPENGGLHVDSLAIKGSAIDVNGQGEILPDGFLRRLQLNADIASQQGDGIVRLPVLEGQATTRGINLAIDYGMSQRDNWHGQLTMRDLKTGVLNAGCVNLNMAGLSANLDDPKNRHVDLQATGGIKQITSSNAAITKAFDRDIVFAADAGVTGSEPFNIQNMSLTANGLSLWLQGQLSQFVFNGRMGVKADSLAPFAALSGQPLSGAGEIMAHGTVAPLSAAFDLNFSGQGQQIKTGNNGADQVLQDNVALSGGVKNDSQGLFARAVKVGNENFSATADGQIAGLSANLDVGLTLRDLALVTPYAQGPLRVKGAARGHNGLIALSLNGGVVDGKLGDKTLKDLTVNFNGLIDRHWQQPSLVAKIFGSGLLNNEKLDLAADFVHDDQGDRLNAIDVRLAGAQLAGHVARASDGAIHGDLALDDDNISSIAALFSTQARGSAHADVKLYHEQGMPQASIKATANNLVVQDHTIAALQLDAKLTDLFDPSSMIAELDAQTMKIADLQMNQLALHSKFDNGQIKFDGKAQLPNRTNTKFSGFFDILDNGNKQIELSTFDITQGAQRMTLKADNNTPPATIGVTDRGVDLSAIHFVSENGTLAMNGHVGETLALDIQADKFPLSVANFVKPELDFQGIITGTATIDGKAEAPRVRFDANGQNILHRVLRQKGVAPFAMKAHGQTVDNIVNMVADFTGKSFNAYVSGKVPLDNSDMDVKVDLKDLSFSGLNRFLQEQNLSGNVEAKAHFVGPLRNPAVDLHVYGQDLVAKSRKTGNVQPVELNAEAGYKDSVVDLKNFDFAGLRELNIRSHGVVPLLGEGIDLTIDGTLPLAIANSVLAERGTKLGGVLSLKTLVNGSIVQPELSGQFRVVDAQLSDITTNLRLDNVQASGRLDGEQITLDTIQGVSSAGGGKVSGSGKVSINKQSDMPIDMGLHLDHVRYSDGEMVTAILNGDLKIQGALLRNPLIGGDVVIETAEIRAPERYGGFDLIDVKHINLKQYILTTLRRADVMVSNRENKPEAGMALSIPQLQINISAPNRIFVRGMGLDSEFGGQMTLSGPVTDIRPVGGFNMIRGRFNILSQRLSFDDGQITLVGKLNPEFNFTAKTSSESIVVTVKITGTVDNLKVEFFSQPELPQDEVLARLIFKRSAKELSSVQLAQLMSTAAELAGLTNTTLLNAVRSHIGLDDFDIFTDNQGNAGVRAGSYLKENIYVGVEAGTQGNTKGTINLDITPELKAKGSVSSEGNSTLGVFYEKDY